MKFNLSILFMASTALAGATLRGNFGPKVSDCVEEVPVGGDPAQVCPFHASPYNLRTSF